MEQKADWVPQFSPWRHGGWYVSNVRYPSGASGCVSNNYPDGKWRIVCDARRNELNQPGDFTFKTRDAAARAEFDLVAAMEVAALAEAKPIPGSVQRMIGFHMGQLKDGAAALEGVMRARGNGHILSLELADRKTAIKSAFGRLQEIRDLAVTNGVEDRFLALVAEHGMPDFVKFGFPRAELPEWVRGAAHKESEAGGVSELPDCLVQLTDQQKELVQAALANDEASSDKELVEHWTGECGIPRAAAEAAVAYRGQFLVDPLLDVFGLYEQSIADRPRG